MTDNHQSGTLWRGAVPVSDRFGDPYYSLEDGLAETRHVFLGGNGLPDRFRPGFHIAELGFGTGLNMLAAWQAWNEAGQTMPLRYWSVEAFPMQPDDMARALSAFPDLAPLTEPLLTAWRAGGAVRSIRTDTLDAQIVIADATEALAAQTYHADAWFLDGFAPARNPKMWQSALMARVARRTAPGGTFATYTAAGHVRRALAQAGFAVERRTGHGRKRHMTVGRLG